MLSYQKGVVKTSVRHLVEFLFRGGDITTGSSVSVSPEAMLEGSRLHRKIQRGQKATYQSEVPLKMEWQEEGYDLVLEGRADGIDKTEVNKDRLSDVDGMNQTESDEEKLQHVIGMNQIESNEEKLTYVDEIKCVYRDVEEIEEADILHLAQAKCYAYMYGVKQDLEKIGVQITYCHLETEQIKRIFYCYTMGELSLWFAEVLDAYRMWAAYYVEAREKRNASIQALQFPFSFRPGQKKMTAIAYQAMENKKHIFLQAPTGVGKTISTLYPALKELGAEKAENIFYLTAKTITRTVAEDTIKLLKKQGLFLSAVTITAKEKICIQEEMQCNPESCERAKGHFDRINEALYALLTAECEISRENILLFAEKYKVCPYELSFEAAVWADCIICDYNYVFDPHVNRKSLIEGSLRQNIYLIDEAHNLLDRAREMYSADIAKSDFKVPKKYFKDRNRFLFKKLGNCVMALRKLEKQAQDGTRFRLHENVDAMYFPIFHLIGPLEEYLADHDNFSEREEIVEFYFKLTHFYMMLDSMDSGYEIYSEKRGRDFLLRLFCVNPSDKLEEYIEQVLQIEAVASKDWLTNKVDRSVSGRVARQQCVGPLQLPLSDVAAVMMDYEGHKGIATSIGHAPVAAMADAPAGSRLAIAEALTNLVWAPIEKGLKGVSLSANWMWPCRNPGEDARLYQAVQAASDFAIALGINIPTGKDSLSINTGIKKCMHPVPSLYRR